MFFIYERGGSEMIRASHRVKKWSNIRVVLSLRQSPVMCFDAIGASLTGPWHHKLPLVIKQLISDLFGITALSKDGSEESV